MVDVKDTDLYRSGHEGARRFVDAGGGRSLLTVALCEEIGDLALKGLSQAIAVYNMTGTQPTP